MHYSAPQADTVTQYQPDPHHRCSQLQCVCVSVGMQMSALICVCFQQECRARKNFSSLYAIVSALQSNPIHRLRKTWQETDRCAAEQHKVLLLQDITDLIIHFINGLLDTETKIYRSHVQVHTLICNMFSIY